MYEVKQSTALTLPFFVHDVSGDAVTGLTDGSFTKRISKNGAAFGAMTVTITELENGWYSITLSTSHSDTLGLLTIVFTNGGAKQVNLQFRVEAKLIDDLNDISSPVTVGTINANALDAAAIAASAMDGKGDWNIGKTGYSLAATGLDAIVAAATGMVEIAKAVWDRVLTGASHAIADSAGRRLRDLQEFGTYEGGAVWIDTVNGSAGTTDFESGTYINPVNTIADANTIAASVGLSRFEVAPGSAITLAAAQDDQQFRGHDWTLALGGQSIAGSYFEGAIVSGIGIGANNPTFNLCDIGTLTVAAGHFNNCDLKGTITLSGAATYFFDHCSHAGTVIIDFGALIVNTTVHLHDYHGTITIANMGQTGTDVLHFSSPDGKLTLAASCIGGTVNMNGTFDFVNNGSGMTINDAGAIIEVIGVPVAADISADIAALPTAVENRTEMDSNSVDLDTIITTLGTAGAGLTDLGGMSTAMKAEVLVEVNAALDTAISELAQAQPTATPSIRTGLMLMYMAMRNKLDVQTSGTDALEIHNAAGTMIARKLLTDAGGDYSEALMVTGV